MAEIKCPLCGNDVERFKQGTKCVNTLYYIIFETYIRRKKNKNYQPEYNSKYCGFFIIDKQK